MGATSRAAIVSAIYKILDYKSLGKTIYPTILQNHKQKTLDAIIGEN